MRQQDGSAIWRPSRRDLLGTAAKAGGLATAALATGCGAGGGAGKGGDVDETDLKAWQAADVDWKQFSGTSLVFGAQQHPWVKAIKKHLAKFEALTGMTVKLQQSGESDFTTKLPVQLGGGSVTPDVFLVPSYPQFVASKWVAQLDRYQNDTKLTDRSFYKEDEVFRSAKSFVTWTDDKMYALPITAEVETIFYRDDLVSGSLDTFEGVAKAAKAAKKGKLAGVAGRGKAEATMGWTCHGYVFSRGGYLIDPDGKAALDSAESFAAVQEYADLLRSAGPPGAAGWDWQQVNQAFEGDKAAMVVDSSVFGSEYVDPDSSRSAAKIKAAAFPERDGKRRPNYWHWVIGLNRRSKHLKAGWLFLMWATSPPTAKLLAKEGVSVPRESVWRSAAFRKDYKADAADIVLDTFKNGDSKPYELLYLHPKWTQVGTYFASAMSSVIAGSSGARHALRQAQRRAEKTLGDG